MDDLAQNMIAVWRKELDTVQRLLADIAAGRTQRPFQAWEIADLNQEADRFASLIAAYEAEVIADKKRPLDVNRRAKRVVDIATGETTDD